MKNYIGHRGGQIVFSTQSPAIYDFAAPDGMEIIEVDAETYDKISPTVGLPKFRVSGDEFILIPNKPSEFHIWDWAANQWTVDLAFAESDIRTKRDRILAVSDWTQLPDVPLATKTAWAVYRQALRDITSQSGFPLAVIWPEAPK